jgi:hypothetical protein
LQSAASHERALRHGEELRLALGSAAREVADLAQQAGVAAAGLEGPLAAALREACREAQRCSEGAQGRVEAAKREEEGLRREAAAHRQRALARRAAVAQGLHRVLRRQGAGGGAASSVDGTSESEGSPATGALAAPVRHAPPQAGLTGRGGQPGPLKSEQQPEPVQHQEQQQAVPASMPGWDPAGSGGPQQHPADQTAAAPGATAGRTAADILAAYRARQQQAAQAAPPAHASTGSDSGGESGDEAGANRTGGGSRGMPPGCGAGVPAAVSRHVPDLTSEDSSRL